MSAILDPLLGQLRTGDANKFIGVLPITNGGTGSSTKNFVDLTTVQTVSGSKTFTDNLLVKQNGSTPILYVYDSDGTSLMQLFHNGGSTGFGTIESTGFVLASDTLHTAITGSNGDQLVVQHAGGSFNSVNIGHDDTNGEIVTTAGNLQLKPAGVVDVSAKSISTDTSTGTKIGTATTQKLGFFNATPIVQVVATTDLGLVLSNLGLRAAGTAYPITTSGTITSTGSLTNNNSVQFSGSFQTSGTTTFNNGATIALAKKLSITTGTNASAGTGTLAAGTVTVSTTVVTANSLIFLTDTASTLTNVGTLSVSSKSAGTSFTVTSSNVLDTSTFNWLIIN